MHLQTVNPFANISATSVTHNTSLSAIDELDAYLAEPCEAMDDQDILKWWLKKKDTYPRLHLMALSYLTAPGTYSPLSFATH